MRVLERISQVAAEAWDGLLGQDPLPFVRHAWFAAMEESGSATRDTGWQPSHLTLWRGSTLVGAAPAYRKTHSMGEYVYDFGWASAASRAGIAYYPKLWVGAPLSPMTAPRLLVRPGEDVPTVRRQLVEGLVELARDARCSSVHVGFPPDEEGALFEAAGFARRLTLQYHWKNPGYRTYEDYLARFDSKRRAQLRRERGAAAKQGIEIRTVRAPGLHPRHAELAYQFYASTCERMGPWGQLQLTREFFRRVVAALPQHVELVEAVRGGQVIAGAFNIATKVRLYGRYWGALEEHPFLHFNVCMYHSVDECIERGRLVFEPGAGGEHKIARGFEPTAVHSAHLIFHPGLDRAVRAFLEQETAELRVVEAQGARIAGLKPWRPAS